MQVTLIFVVPQASPTAELESKHLAGMDLKGASPSEMSARMAANATRGLIKSVFERRSCFALKTPHAGDGSAIQSAGDEALSQEFLQVRCPNNQIDRPAVVIPVKTSTEHHMFAALLMLPKGDLPELEQSAAAAAS
jgi:hypothetical protein